MVPCGSVKSKVPYRLAADSFQNALRIWKNWGCIKTSIPGSAGPGGILINGKRIGIKSGDEGITNLGTEVYRCISKCSEKIN